MESARKVQPASAFELFKIGLGPSSSHTMGPMLAALHFVELLEAGGALERVARVETELFGSLALTGRGHGTDVAVIAGLSGCHPQRALPEDVATIVAQARASGTLALDGRHAVAFDERRDLAFLANQSLSYHPNAVRFHAFDAAAAPLRERTFYSVGGGFVVDEDEAAAGARSDAAVVPYPFDSAATLLEMARREGRPIAALVRANELARGLSEAEIDERIAAIVAVMGAAIERGMHAEGELPGGLHVLRRAAALYRKLSAQSAAAPHTAFDWVSLFAIAVNEENAAGGRIVTAPTNGAAGIIPAVLRYYQTMCAHPGGDRTLDFMLTASAFGAICKMNASISGAEVGCQGEVGVACAMAAAGLAAALGGSNEHVENAAEIGLEHHLGMTCDPIGGLVQVPCIERNAMGAVKAIAAASLALNGTGEHMVSFDAAVTTMRETGRDMMNKYKETARGGLAVHVVEC